MIIFTFLRWFPSSLANFLESTKIGGEIFDFIIFFDSQFGNLM